MTISYACSQRFDANEGQRWFDYLRWLGRTDLQCVVTLDGLLCPPLVQLEEESDWQFAVTCGDYLLDLFTSLEFVMQRAAAFPRSMILAAARDPSPEEVSAFTHPDFEFAGYDIVDRPCTISALLNCGGGFRDVFSLAELSPTTGLISSRERAFEIRDTLRGLYPGERHADCFVWALWQRTGNTGRASQSPS
jgi:hypothetical protein